MIHTSRQLKALVRNRSNGDSAKAQTIITRFSCDNEKVNINTGSNLFGYRYAEIMA